MSEALEKWVNLVIAFESDLFAVLVKVTNKKVEIHQITDLFDYGGNKDKFLDQLDQVLVGFYNQNGIEVKEAIFVLSQDWLVANDLSPNRKDFLKQAKKSLSLKVNGFVVLEEALIFKQRQLSLSPPSFLLFNLLPTIVGITRIELGRISEHVAVGRSQNIADDISEALSRLQGQVFPTRVSFLFNLNNGQQNKLKHQIDHIDWQGQLGFPQQPELNFIDKDQLVMDISRVIFSNANHPDELQVVLMTESTPPMMPEAKLADDESLPVEAKPEIDSLKPETKIEPIQNAPPKPKLPKLDLSPSQDQSFKPTDSSQDNKSMPAEPNLADLGVFLDENSDNQETTSQPPAGRPPTIATKLPAKFSFAKVFNLFNKKPRFRFNFLAKLAGIVPKINSGLPSVSKLVFVFIPFLILPALAGLVYYLFFQAEIVIVPKTETATKIIEIKFDNQVKSPDYDNFIIPSRLVEVTITKTAETTTTGKVEEGEPGQGKITIYNKTNQVKTLNNGTSLYLTNDSKKKVVLTEKVTVASQSSQVKEDEAVLYIPGKATVKAKTTFFGDEANLNQGTELKFTKLDNNVYKAKVATAFTGGKKYEVQAVSKNDINKLKDQIKKQVDSELDQLVRKSLKDGEAIINNSTKIEYLTEDFNYKLNQPAEKVNLKSKIKISVLAYNKQDIQKLVDDIVATTAPEGFSVDKNQVKWQFIPQEKDHYQLKVNMPLTWDLNPSLLNQNLKAKSRQDAYFYLQNLPGVFAFKISFKPPVPKSLQYMPLKADNIKVKLQSNL